MAGAERTTTLTPEEETTIVTVLRFGVDAEAAGETAVFPAAAEAPEEAAAEALVEAAAEVLEEAQAAAAGAAIRRMALKEAARMEEAERVSVVDMLQAIGNTQLRREGERKEIVKATIYDRKSEISSTS